MTQAGTNQTKLEIYCNSIMEHIDINIHIAMWIAIGLLLLLSWVELFLECYGKCMPYHHFFEPISKEDPLTAYSMLAEMTSESTVESSLGVLEIVL